MYISSPTHKLRTKQDFDSCEIVFNLRNVNTMSKGIDGDIVLRDSPLFAEDLAGPNLFSENYEPRQQMRYQYFRAVWNEERKLRQTLTSQSSNESDPRVWDMTMDCDEWLISKLIFSREEIDLIFNPADKPSDQVLKPETEEEKQKRQQLAEEAKWPKDIELDFHKSRPKGVRQRATRYFKSYSIIPNLLTGL